MTDDQLRTHGQEKGVGLAADLTRYAAIARQRWYVILGSAVLCVAAAAWFQRGTLPVYTAEVLLQQQSEDPLTGTPLGFSATSDFGTHLELLRSRAVLAAVVDSLGLQLRLVTHRDRRSRLIRSVTVEPGARGYYLLEVDGDALVLVDGNTGEALSRSSVDSPVEGPGFSLTLEDPDAIEEVVEFAITDREVAIENLRGRIRVQQAGGASLLRVSFNSPDAELSAAVANTVASSYQRHQAGTARQDAGRRRDVIAGEISLLADSLRRAQDDVESYQANSQLLNPDVEGNALMAALLESENELRRLRFNEGLLESLVLSLNGDSGDDDSLRRIMALGSELIPSGPSLDQRLQDLQAERDRLTASRFGATQSSPEVQVVDALVASTRDQMRITAEQSLEILKLRIAAAVERLAEIRGQIGALPVRSSEFTRLEQRVDAVQGVFDRLVERYYEAQISEGVEAGDVEVVDPAPIPLGPQPSMLTLNLLIAALGGLVLGVLGAVVLEHMDPRVRRIPEAQEASGLQVLGTVPRIRSISGHSRSVLIGMEAFRGIRTNLQFALDGDHQVLGVCSAAPGEGKSTVAVNLAQALVEQGKRVLILDSDLRRGRLHLRLKVDRTPGLAEVLTGESSLSEAIRPSPINPTLEVLPSGRPDGVHETALHGGAFAKLLDQLRPHYDAIVIDTAPILAVSDASLTASLVDGNIVVVRANSTDREALERAVEQLRRAKAKLVGLVFNGAKLESVGYSEYYDSYHQDVDAASPRPHGNGGQRLLVGLGGKEKA